MTDLPVPWTITPGSSLAISMETEWLQPPAVTQDSISSLTITQGSIRVWLPNPEDLRDFSVGYELEILVYVVKALGR